MSRLWMIVRKSACGSGLQLGKTFELDYVISVRRPPRCNRCGIRHEMSTKFLVAKQPSSVKGWYRDSKLGIPKTYGAMIDRCIPIDPTPEVVAEALASSRPEPVLEKGGV